jgi:aquaporin Z
LTVINLVAIPVTNCSANPARSLGVAWFAGGGALSQMWLFIVAPTVGAAIAGAMYALVTGAPTLTSVLPRIPSWRRASGPPNRSG